MTSKKRDRPDTYRDRPFSTAERLTTMIASVVAIIVMAGTVLMVAPVGTPLKKQVQSIAAPYFSQNWKVFAPNIMKVNFSLEMRAQWRDEDGDLLTSGWVSITEIESQTVHGNLAPSRIQKNSWNSLQTYLTRYKALDAGQQGRVRDTFIQRVDDSFAPIPDAELIAELGPDDPDVIRFLRMDYMLMRYTTLYATAGFGKNIERVQWRIVSERPNDFQHRFQDVPQFDPTVTTFGWRHSNVRVSRDVIAEYSGIIERTGRQGSFGKAAADAK